MSSRLILSSSFLRLVACLDLEALAEEFSEVCGGKENFIAIYRAATKKKFGFLFITMGAKPRFYNGYSSEFKIDSDDESEYNLE